MNLPQTYIHNHIHNQRGFTVVELLVVIGIFATMASLGMWLSADTYRSRSFQTDVNTVVSVLQRARSRAMNNVNETSHGVKLNAAGYTLFQTGDSSKDEVIEGNPTFLFSGPTEILFSQLSGDSSATGLLVITSGAKTATISLNNEGQISW